MTEKLNFLVHFITNKPSTWLGLIWFLGGLIMMLIVYPIIYNYFVIPKIENRTGKKLEYTSFCYVYLSNYLWPIGGKKIAKYVDVGPYICSEYTYWKFKIRFKIDPLCSLARIGYDITKASRLEIVTSFSVLIFVVLLFSLAFLVQYLMHHGH